MANVEKISIALPADMATLVRNAVETGDYASSSEVIREALREWKARRAARKTTSRRRAGNLLPSAGRGGRLRAEPTCRLPLRA